MDITTRHLTVTIDAATQYATIRLIDGDRIYGTLQRKRVIATGPAWRAFRADGSEVGRGFFSARQALVVMERTL